MPGPFVSISARYKEVDFHARMEDDGKTFVAPIPASGNTSLTRFTVKTGTIPPIIVERFDAAGYLRASHPATLPEVKQLIEVINGLPAEYAEPVEAMIGRELIDTLIQTEDEIDATLALLRSVA